MITTEYYKQDEILKYIEDNAGDYISDVEDINDLHHYLFNQDYYEIYTYKAIEWLSDQVFECIGVVVDYETSNFGQVSTDLTNPCDIVNMYVYIVGEELLYELGDDWLENQKEKEN